MAMRCRVSTRPARTLRLPLLSWVVVLLRMRLLSLRVNGVVLPRLLLLPRLLGVVVLLWQLLQLLLLWWAVVLLRMLLLPSMVPAGMVLRLLRLPGLSIVAVRLRPRAVPS